MSKAKEISLISPTTSNAIAELLHDFVNRFVLVYIDDLIIQSKTFDEHIEHLKQVFQRLREGN